MGAPPVPDSVSLPSLRRRRVRPTIWAAGALALTLVGGVVGWVWWDGRSGGGETVEFRVGDPGAQVSPDDMERIAETLGVRVEKMGAGEPVITSADGTLLVELPRGLSAAAAVSLMERPGVLSVRPVLGVTNGADSAAVLPWDEARAPAQTSEDTEGGEMSPEEFEELIEGLGGDDESAENPADVELTLPEPDMPYQLQLGAAKFGNEGVETAVAEIDKQSGVWQVSIVFTDAGGAEWAELTGEVACHPEHDPRRRIALVVDDEVLSAPTLTADTVCGEGLTGAETVISGSITDVEALTFAALISTDPLPLPVTAEP